MPVNTVELPVRGMSCASCVAKIESALGRQLGVQEAIVNLAAERATIRFGDGATPLALVNVIRNLGHEVHDLSISPDDKELWFTVTNRPYTPGDPRVGVWSSPQARSPGSTPGPMRTMSRSRLTGRSHG